MDVCGKEVGHAVSSLMLKDVRLSFRALSSSEMAIMEQLISPTASPLPFTRHHMRGVDCTPCTTTRGSLFAM